MRTKKWFFWKKWKARKALYLAGFRDFSRNKKSLFQKKSKKIEKRCWLLLAGCGIITKPSKTASRSKEFEKYFKKVLDNKNLVRYNKQAVPRGRAAQDLENWTISKLERNLIVMENHVKQFQYTSNSWMQALLYLRNYSDLIQSNLV